MIGVPPFRFAQLIVIRVTLHRTYRLLFEERLRNISNEAFLSWPFALMDDPDIGIDDGKRYAE